MFFPPDDQSGGEGPDDHGQPADGPDSDHLPNVGSITDDTSVYRARRLSVRFRRRVLVAGAAAVVVCGVVAGSVAAAMSGKSGSPGTPGGATTFSAVSSTLPAGTTGTGLVSTTTSTVRVKSTGTAAERAKAVHANELGRIPILMYHKIGNDVVPPDRLRDDIARLKAAGFYPTTVREMASGTMDIPAGKMPVILSFDDSSPTHYKILPDGSIDPDCAVGILLAESKAGDWPAKASFFPLLYLETKADILFGQPEYAQQKLQNMVKWGMEIGSHTVDHLDLAKSSTAHIEKELAQSQTQLDQLIGGGYKLYTINPPYGDYPSDVSILSSGEYNGVTYEYKAAVKAGGGYAYSPFSTRFDPMEIPRVSAYHTNIVPDLVWYSKAHHGLMFISDGDPNTVSAPAGLTVELGTFRTDLGKQVVWY